MQVAKRIVADCVKMLKPALDELASTPARRKKRGSGGWFIDYLFVFIQTILLLWDLTGNLQVKK